MGSSFCAAKSISVEGVQFSSSLIIEIFLARTLITFLYTQQLYFVVSIVNKAHQPKRVKYSILYICYFLFTVAYGQC